MWGTIASLWPSQLTAILATDVVQISNSPLETSSTVKHPKVQRGPFDRIQNLTTIRTFFEDDNGKKWILNAEKGPFRGLGEKRINEIVAGSRPDIIVGRLNNALEAQNSILYRTIEDWIPQDGPFPKLPNYSYANFTRLSDDNGQPLMVKALKECLDHPEKLSKIGQLIDLGVKINKPIRLTIEAEVLALPPLTAAWKLTTEKNTHRTDQIHQVADYLLEKGANINQTVDTCGNNILGFLGLHFNDAQLLSWYLNHQGEVNFQNNSGQTFFHLLANDDTDPWTNEFTLEIAKKLIHAGIDLSVADTDGNHPIHVLCNCNEGGNQDLLKLLLQTAPKERYVLDAKGHSCAYLCCAGGNTSLLKIIMGDWDRSIASPGTPDELIESVCKFAPVFGYSPDQQHRILEERSMPAIHSFLPYLGDNEEQRRQAFIHEEKGTTQLHALARVSPWLPETLVKDSIIKEDDLQIKDSDGISVADLVTTIKAYCDFYHACYVLDKTQMFALLEQYQTPDKLPVSKNLLLDAFLLGVFDAFQAGKKVSVEVQMSMLSKLLEFGLDPNYVLSDDGNTPMTFILRYFPDLNCIYTLLDYGIDSSEQTNEAISVLQDMIQNSSNDKERYQLLLNAVMGAVR